MNLLAQTSSGWHLCYMGHICRRYASGSLLIILIVYLKKTSKFVVIIMLFSRIRALSRHFHDIDSDWIRPKSGAQLINQPGNFTRNNQHNLAILIVNPYSWKYQQNRYRQTAVVDFSCDYRLRGFSLCRFSCWFQLRKSVKWNRALRATRWSYRTVQFALGMSNFTL